jgi:crotonobetainyl-CoA:carnitine CoA-transferase CaiB-like acyl-CoA transferase
VKDENGEETTFRTFPTFPHISGVEQEQRFAAPGMGEHTDELLREAGYSDAEIEQFRAGGVI